MNKKPLYDNKTIFKFRMGNDYERDECTFIGGSWEEVTADDLFKDKKIVMFGLPGAFTPTCSSQQVPAYEEHYDEFKDLGIDAVYCISVNDAFVMNAWERALRTEKVKFIPDGSGEFTKSLSMLINKPGPGFGMRSWRYSAYVEDREIVQWFVEEGLNDLSIDNDPYEVSDPENMLKFLEGRLGYQHQKLTGEKKKERNEVDPESTTLFDLHNLKKNKNKLDDYNYLC
jgi:peroxiredoxin|tara:strand:+ start:27 stop:710 length:684 start_codon:yes stop_codon:yes gene_type:complete